MRNNRGVKGFDGSWSYDQCTATCVSSQVGAFLCGEDEGYDSFNSDFHPDFPPKELIDVGFVSGLGFMRDPDLYPNISAWFNETFAAVEYEGMVMSEREKMMYMWSATDYVAAFKAGNVTALEYATALVKRMLHYRMLNAFFVTSYVSGSISRCLHRPTGAHGLDLGYGRGS